MIRPLRRTYVVVVREADGMTLTLHKSQVHCSDQFTVHTRWILCLQRQVAELTSELLYCQSLSRNNNMVINLETFTSSYGSRRFAECDQQGSHCGFFHPDLFLLLIWVSRFNYEKSR